MLYHSKGFKKKDVEELEKCMAVEIFQALERLDLQRWNTGITEEYMSDLIDKQVLAAEREEGLKEGRKIGSKVEVDETR